MFGYVIVNKPELRVREYDTYHAYYCGLCHTLKRKFGPLGSLTLSFDMTFLGLLLTSLNEAETKESSHRCVVHPLSKHPRRENEYLDYAADMNLLLSYYNLLDNWQDDHDLKSYALAKTFRHSVKKIQKKYPRQSRAVDLYLSHLSQCEKEGNPSLDYAAGLTGEMFAEIFIHQEDLWSPTLRRMGFFLGKFIYLMDAWEDRREDQKKQSYNPWNLSGDISPERAFQILTMMMSECALAFEQLPILEDVEILRNILYSGVWTRFEQLKEKHDNV